MSGVATKVGLGAGAGVAFMALLAEPGKTWHSIEWLWTFLLRVVEHGPISLKAIALAILAGWLVQLRVSMLPLRSMSPAGALLLAQSAGSLASFSVVWWLWRDPMGLLVGAIVALSTPYTWGLFLIALESFPGGWSQRWAAELRGEGRSLLPPKKEDAKP